MLLALVLSQIALPSSPSGPIVSNPATLGRAFFEAFPANGAGTTGVCSTTAPTGAKGEALTFTRATAATCTKGTNGLRTTGIADGDLVVVGSGVARQEIDSNGVLGLLVEEARTNLTLRSQEFDNAAWSNDVAPTANAATAPDGTVTAERFVFAATGAGARSVSFQSGGCASAGASSVSVYVRGVSGSGTTDVCQGAPSTCAACAFVSTSWTRCTVTGAAAAPGYLVVGNATLWNGGTTRTQSDVYVWGAQCETAAFPTSYIPTTSATVTRNAETGSFALPVAMSATAGSHAASFQIPTVAAVAVNLIRYQAGASPLYFYPSSQLLRTYDGTNEITNNTPAPAANTVYRVSSTYSGSVQAVTDWVPDTTSGAFDGQMGTTALSSATVCGLEGSQASFICSRICADPDTTRCR